VIVLPPSLGAIANSFYVASASFALPSAAVLVMYSVYRVQLWVSPSPEETSFPKNPDAILLILQGIVRAVSGTASVLGRVGSFLFNGLAMISVLALVFAFVLFLTGRGLHAHQGWSRGVAGIITSGLFLVSFLSLMSIRGPLVLLPAVLAATSFVATWSVWRGFAL